MKRDSCWWGLLLGFVMVPTWAQADPAAVPSVSIAPMLTLDSASGEAGTSYDATTAVGIGFRGNGSLIGLLSRANGGEGIFFRDWWLIELAGGAGGNGLYGRGFVGVGARLGLASRTSSFFVSPRVFTGASTVRNPLSAGSGAGRWAWLLGAGFVSQGFSAEAAYGRGDDTAGDDISVFDLEVSFGSIGTARMPIFARYQGNFGTRMTEHNLSAGLLLRY